MQSSLCGPQADGAKLFGGQKIAGSLAAYASFRMKALLGHRRVPQVRGRWRAVWDSCQNKPPRCDLKYSTLRPEVPGDIYAFSQAHSRSEQRQSSSKDLLESGRQCISENRTSGLDLSE